MQTAHYPISSSSAAKKREPASLVTATVANNCQLMGKIHW